MTSLRIGRPWLSAVSVLLGSAACVHYRAAPLDPPGLAAAYAVRRLDDAALRRFLAAATATPDIAWTPHDLALVALYYHPDLDVARATWQQAVAGEITAGARPQPSGGVTVDRAARVDEGKSTNWSVTPRARYVGEPGWLQRVKQAYGRGIHALERRPGVVLASAGGLVLLALVMVPYLGGAFLPEFKEGHYVLHMSAVPGTSIDESLRLGAMVTKALRANPRVRGLRVSQQRPAMSALLPPLLPRAHSYSKCNTTSDENGDLAIP